VADKVFYFGVDLAGSAALTVNFDINGPALDPALADNVSPYNLAPQPAQKNSATVEWTEATELAALADQIAVSNAAFLAANSPPAEG
jgi:hypothetical protein